MKNIIICLLVILVLPSAVMAKVKQEQLDDLETRLGMDISDLKSEIEQIKERQNLYISTSSSISKLTDLLQENEIKLKITSDAAQKLLETNTTGIITACLNAYLENLPAKETIEEVDIVYTKRDNDFSRGVEYYADNVQKRSLEINVKYWGYDSNLAHHSPALKATECFDVVYTKFIKP